MAAKGREWNYEEARDRTGEPFQAVPHVRSADEFKRDLRLFRNPVEYRCLNCNNSREFRFMVDGAPGDNNLIMIACRCGASWRAMELRIPQMDNTRAKNLGLTLPDKRGLIPLDMEIDLDD